MSVIFVSPGGDDGADGTAKTPVRSLRRALLLARSGDTVRLAPGVYEGGVETAVGGVSVEGPQGAVVRGPSDRRGIQVQHPRTTLRGFTVEKADIGVWLYGVSGCVLEGLTLRDIGGEGVRIKNQSQGNVVRRCRFERMGREGFDAAKGRKNGEGVYIGTAPEQRSRNTPPNVPDRCTGNRVEDCTFRTEAAEAVDIKEDSEGNSVLGCVGEDSRDPEGAVFGARGDANRFERCVARGGRGHGFRFGGDTVKKGEHGQTQDRVYGKNNVLRHCRAERNARWGVAAMVTPQDVDETNVFAQNGEGAIHRKKETSG